MQHFAEFGIVKQVNKQRKKFNEVVQGGQQFMPESKDSYLPRYISKDPEKSIQDISKLYQKNASRLTQDKYPEILDGIQNKRQVQGLPTRMSDDYGDLVAGYKKINRRAIKATTVDPLTMPYKQSLDWNAPQSFGSILKGGLKTKPVRQSSNESPLDRTKRFYEDYESIKPDNRGYGVELGESFLKGAKGGAGKAWRSSGGMGGLLF